jgi:multidrug resistance efflux pump
MAATTSSEDAAPSAKTGAARRPALIALACLLLLFGVSVAMERLTPSTSQAVVRGFVVPMAAEVAGRVSEVPVLDNSRIRAGEVLFRIDSQRYTIAVAQAKARLDGIGQTLGASTAAVQVAQARLAAAQASRENIREQAARVLQLVDRGVYPKARYDQAKAALDGSEAAVEGAQADLERARQELGPTGADNPQLRDALAALEQAQLDLLRTTVTAPSDGVVTNLQLSPGQFVSVGQAALTFIEARSIWVAADFKENSLEHVTPGDAGEVILDSLPGRIFPVKVESIGWGVSLGVAGGSALPTVRNDRGWVREPQRFPVRLVFDERPPDGIRYGAQVNVVVYTGDNPVINALGAFWIRLISVLTYVS